MWHFLKGYVILQAEGMSLARLLRRLSENGVRVRGLREERAGSIRFETDVKGFFRLHALKRGLPVRIHILERHGFPFLLQRLRKRPVLWIGTAAVLIGLFLFSQRIWLIRFEGIETIDRAELSDLLKEHGIRIGARPKGPVLITAANDLSVRIRDAAWIGLDREGITLKVSVVEALPESEKHAQTVPSDIVADRDGIITKILVTRGQARVKIGDTVHKGDVLISGTVIRKDASYQTWANGTVCAAVRYEAECELCNTITEAVLTERTGCIRALRIGDLTILRSQPEFERYRITRTETIPVGYGLPTYCDRILTQEVVIRERTVSDEEAEQIALANAREAALDMVPKNAVILNQYGTIHMTNGTKTAVVIVTAEENIGRTEEYPNDG